MIVKLPEVWVPGEPKGKGRHRTFRTKAGINIQTADPKSREYEGNIAFWAKHIAGPLLWPNYDGPVRLDWVALFTIPKSKAKKIADGYLCIKKPDRDNIDKLICDALNGIAWLDDKQVASGYIDKRYTAGEPGISIKITYLEVDE